MDMLARDIAEFFGTDTALDAAISTFFGQDFDPDQPRDEEGKWSETGAGGDKPRRMVPLDRSQPLPAHIAALKKPIPPAWTDVYYNPDPEGDLMVTGRDAKGNLQPIYSDEHTSRQSEIKFARVNELMHKYDEMAARNEQAKQDPRRRDAAEAMELVMKMGLRPGSGRDTGAEKQAYGATTLKGSHIRVQPSGYVALHFTGKSGVELNLEVKDPALRAILIARKEQAGPRGKIFRVSDQGLRDHLKSIDGFKVKDFRTHAAAETAMEMIAKVKRLPKTEKEYKKAVKIVATAVSKVLGNTPTVALASYIPPEVFAEWRMSAGVA
jgi:DNA topoisomerase-1